ncbi:hypothetical protein JRC04_05400 [Mycolicibacterium sp. S2-37]|uniref:hypothetical protein n=1 Tax=Mycolicibacterium sp. S2-37 TaxID=2810297 RepID=UPI001A94E721|nr:hypothetical protein [Mycolicibacterium sp. S2-37]MBO0676891.1 hypothetical protein [Mycolicibacterium sp. S2-37]
MTPEGAKAILRSVTGRNYDDNPEFVLQVASELLQAVDEAIETLKYHDAVDVLAGVVP